MFPSQSSPLFYAFLRLRGLCVSLPRPGRGFAMVSPRQPGSGYLIKIFLP